jgi:hypothetical protein
MSGHLRGVMDTFFFLISGCINGDLNVEKWGRKGKEEEG